MLIKYLPEILAAIHIPAFIFCTLGFIILYKRIKKVYGRVFLILIYVLSQLYVIRTLIYSALYHFMFIQPDRNIQLMELGGTDEFVSYVGFGVIYLAMTILFFRFEKTKRDHHEEKRLH